MNRKPPRIFFGWWIVVAAFFVALYIGGVVYYGFTVLFKPIADDLGWSYTQISLALSLRGIEAGALAPVTGVLTDRLGPRRIIFAGGIIVALSLFLLSQTTSLLSFYVAFTIMAFGMSCCGVTVPMTSIANWFRRRVGLASGIAVCGFGFSGLIIPLMLELVNRYEWRTTTLILAVGTLIIVLPLSLVFRHKPEQYGYLPDNQQQTPAQKAAGTAAEVLPEKSIRIKEAMKMRVFWHIAVAFTCHLMLVSSIVTHIMPYLLSIGMSEFAAGWISTLVPLMSVGGRLGFGQLSDRLGSKRVLMLALSLVCLGTFFLTQIPSFGIAMAIIFVILFGLGYGGNNVMRAPLIREYFGRLNFGTIFGVMMGVNSIGGLIGPPLAGASFDRWASYLPAWYLFVGIAIVGFLAVATMPKKKAISP